VIDGHHAPAPSAFVFIEVEAGDCAIVCRKSEPGLRRQVEYNGDRGTNGAAMRHGNDVAATMRFDEIGNRCAYAPDKVGETLAARRALVGGAEPETSRRHLALSEKVGAVEPLPLTEILFREIGDLL
jgi:hypothetical protein